ncbi:MULTISPECIES: ABC transporter permease [Gordonibacter]|uniref:ABC transporter permease subunit n=1 Tax=Gordonibacter faecis TaxID=3047475 RepID=A0ABT7DN72_9ACTN|nr:ABC transporter permease [Gordonibacter sp. KGMB12511]MDJ1650983.1 ABC transporter permease subunit [Gordonibacter sp. KGMB12511]HIW76946.1 ABC transporter permease subunit [Candidatus Gordonibacter avicola]
MRGSTLTIAKKELARFFANRVSAVVSIVLPGLLIFVMWTFMGDAMSTMFAPDETARPTVAVVNEPASIAGAAETAGIDIVPEAALPDAAQMRERIEAGEVRAFAVFPTDFDEAVAAYDPASGMPAPQVELYANSTDADSSHAATLFTALLDSYESSLSNRFDINAGGGTYELAEERDLASTIVVTIVPFMLIILLFTSVMSIAAESVAGEKERGTMATLLATPIRRRDIALGKLLAITLIGLLVAASSMIGIFASLPSMFGSAMVDLNVYGLVEYVEVALVIVSTTLVVVMLITIVSTLASSMKEASMYLTPVMILVMLVAVLGMFGGTQTDSWYYFIPLYNSVQCLNGILSFNFQPLNVVICIVTNLVVTGVGVLVLQRMFDSERLMFRR